MSSADLLSYLFDGRPSPLEEPAAAWLGESRRFTEFVEAHANKIRKKIRTAQDAESLRDLQLELETAYLLLRERSLRVTYEPGHPREGRSPDFAVSYTTSMTFMVEVTRLRGEAQAWERFPDVLCGKLGQLLPQRANVLIAGLEGRPPLYEEVHAALLRLQQRAERNDPGVVARQGFRDRGDFFQHYERLSAVLVRGIPLGRGEAARLWVNARARHPLPARVRTAIERCMAHP
jgi:hypothetical protein